ncbi:dipeptide epimerase [Fulvivirgaceae bacterium BMA10]|uniref:Dipeptide epimerase n=1 Tax=Splendidivirga corallicola TaxID=3051826 RepID=A0ABT8KP64_9BACT|nr:dipeptide epimerase [Fulvivirgaceae bacterium BMA10]
MKIKDIKVSKENLELSRPYAIAFKTISSVENCIVQIETDQGLIGYGSGNPSEQVVGESIRDSMEALESENISWLIGRDIRDLHQLCFEINEKMNGFPAASAALDIALHDLFSQHLNIPLVQYLGQKIKSLPTSITIGIKTVEEALEEAKEYIDRRFRILKVKLGKSFEEDVEVLTKLRERFGNQVLIRIDANQGYDIQQLMLFHRRTEKLDLELIEQPLPAQAISDMSGLPVPLKQRIAADESLLNSKDAFMLALLNACGIFNIKLMKCGGIYQAQKIASIAEHANIDLMWGCNDESIISITAALHVAFSRKNTKYIDLDGSLDLAKDVVQGGFVLNDGMMSINEKPGLGLMSFS